MKDQKTQPTVPTFKIKYKNNSGFIQQIETDFRKLFMRSLKIIRDLGFTVINIKFKPQNNRLYWK